MTVLPLRVRQPENREEARGWSDVLGVLSRTRLHKPQLQIVLAILCELERTGAPKVRLSTAELADRCGRRVSSGFRKQLSQLQREGVLIRTPGGGARKSTMAVNPAPEAWGRFAPRPRAREAR